MVVTVGILFVLPMAADCGGRNQQEEQVGMFVGEIDDGLFVCKSDAGGRNCNPFVTMLDNSPFNSIFLASHSEESYFSGTFENCANGEAWPERQQSG